MTQANLITLVYMEFEIFGLFTKNCGYLYRHYLHITDILFTHSPIYSINYDLACSRCTYIKCKTFLWMYWICVFILMFLTISILHINVAQRCQHELSFFSTPKLWCLLYFFMSKKVIHVRQRICAIIVPLGVQQLLTGAVHNFVTYLPLKMIP